MRTALVLALFAFAGACSGGSSDPALIVEPPVQPEPPPGTGVQQIVMEGEWQMTAIERLDGLPSLPNPVPGALPFVPVQIGQTLRVVDGRLRDDFGAPLFEPVAHDFYANVADGRTLWFEVHDFEPTVPSQFSVQAIFGSSGPDEITGFVSVVMIGPPFHGLFMLTDPDGSFLVRATRVPPTPVDQPTSAR